MVKVRVDASGSYYGSDFDDSDSLTIIEMTKNAETIMAYLCNNYGWSKNAVCGMLGNMQAESTINPGRWQSDDVGNTSMGYGLVQWTPATKYINWCEGNGYDDPSTMIANLNRIIYEVNNNIQWISTNSYPMTFKDFTTSNASVSSLAKAFLLCYERPADQSASVQEYRSKLAEQWYSILPGGNSGTTKMKRKYNFTLFCANKRRNEEWIRNNF